ncbi:MAG: helix-turn-helix transcriptional regulator [Vibrio sp.]
MSEQNNSSLVRTLTLFRKVPSENSVGESTKVLYESMVTAGFKVTKRTIERDLIKLEGLGFIISTEENNGNYWRKLGKQGANNLLLEPEQAMALIASQDVLKKVLPYSTYSLLDLPYTKATNTLKGNPSYSKWEDKVFLIQGELTPSGINYDQDIYQAMHEAVFTENKVRLMYQKQGAEQPEEYILSPFGIVVRDYYTYLIATKEQEPDQYRLFSTHRMHSIENLYLDLDKQPAESLSDFLKKNSVFGLLDDEHKKYKIKLYIRRYTYEWVKFNKLHPEQVLSELDEDNWATVEFKSYMTYELVGWILKQSVDVIVDQPLVLKECIINNLKASLNNY